MIENVLLMVIQVYIFVLVVRSLLSYFPNVDYRNPIIRLLIDITEPVLKPIRRSVGIQSGMDFSPMIVIIALYVAMVVVRRIL